MSVETGSLLHYMRGISKSFPGVKALQEVNFDLQTEKFMPCLGLTVLVKAP